MEDINFNAYSIDDLKTIVASAQKAIKEKEAEIKDCYIKSFAKAMAELVKYVPDAEMEYNTGECTEEGDEIVIDFLKVFLPYKCKDYSVMELTDIFLNCIAKYY